MGCERVSKIGLRLIQQQGSLCAFASCVFEDNFFLNDIAVHHKLGGGYRLVFPARTLGNQKIQVYCPINHQTERPLTEAITSAFVTLINKPSLVKEFSQERITY